MLNAMDQVKKRYFYASMVAFQKHNFPVHIMEVFTTHICNCTLTFNSNCGTDAQRNGQSKQITFLLLYAMTYMPIQ